MGGRLPNGSRDMEVFASGKQLNVSSQPHSLNEVVSQSEAGDEICELQDVISKDREDPAAGPAGL